MTLNDLQGLSPTASLINVIFRTAVHELTIFQMT